MYGSASWCPLPCIGPRPLSPPTQASPPLYPAEVNIVFPRRETITAGKYDAH